MERWARRDKELSTWGLMKEHYNNLDVKVGLAGLSCNLLDLSGRTEVELVAVTVDEVALFKDGGKDRIEFTVHHIQMDDLGPQSLMPVLLGPTDSGQ